MVTYGAVGPFGLGPLELVIILVILVMIFGASRLTDIGGSLGKGIKEFRKNVKDEAEDEDGAASAAGDAPEASVAAPVASPAMETVAAVKCPSCGALNDVEAKHCNQCGTAMGAPVS